MNRTALRLGQNAAAPKYFHATEGLFIHSYLVLTWGILRQNLKRTAREGQLRGVFLLRKKKKERRELPEKVLRERRPRKKE